MMNEVHEAPTAKPAPPHTKHLQLIIIHRLVLVVGALQPLILPLGLQLLGVSISAADFLFFLITTFMSCLAIMVLGIIICIAVATSATGGRNHHYTSIEICAKLLASHFGVLIRGTFML